MKNTVVKFDYTDVYDDYIVQDYTSRKLYDIYEMPELKLREYIDYYQLSDNETIEQVSYKLYTTAMYWDVLLYINEMDPLYSMVYDFDFSRDLAVKIINDMNKHYVGTIKWFYNPIRDEIYNPITNEVPPLENITAEQMNADERIPQTYLDELTDLKTDELERLKEARRVIKIIKPERMSDFMRIIRQRKII